MKRWLTDDRLIRGSVALVFIGFIVAGVVRQVTRTSGSAWDAWRPVVALLAFLPIGLIVVGGLAVYLKEQLALPKAERSLDRRWVLVPVFGILALVHLLQLFVLPLGAMNIFYHGTFVEDTLRGLGARSLMAPVYLAFIVTMFFMLRYSFVIVAFYLFRAIDTIFVGIRSTINYILMIASPIAYFTVISVFDRGELRFEILETVTGIMLSHYLALAVCSVIVRHRRRTSLARVSYLLAQFGAALVILSIAVTALFFYLAYRAIETDLVWRLVFYGFLVSGAYGSFRFYYQNSEELWVVKEQMDEE